MTQMLPWSSYNLLAAAAVCFGGAMLIMLSSYLLNSVLVTKSR